MSMLRRTGPIFGARLRHERYIASIVLGVVLLGTAVVGWRILTVEATSGSASSSSPP